MYEQIIIVIIVANTLVMVVSWPALIKIAKY